MKLVIATPTQTKVVSALIPGEQRQAVLLDGEPSEDVEKFKYLDSMFVATGQGTKEIRSRINFAGSEFFSCNPVFGRGVKYRCVQKAGSTRY